MDEIEVVIEVPAGSRNKYELDHDTGALRLSRTLFTAARFPVDYGYVEGTMGGDGDPVDALVHLEEPAVPGCRVTCRPVAVLWIESAAGREPKVLCVPTFEREAWQGLDDVPERYRREIGQFFEIYKDIEKDDAGAVKVLGWEDAEAARTVLAELREK